MKFKYNFFTNTLAKLEGEYTREITENNHFSTSCGDCVMDNFHLGEKEWIAFILSYFNLKIVYQKGNLTYQKTLDLPNIGEITFEITEQDLCTS